MPKSNSRAPMMSPGNIAARDQRSATVTISGQPHHAKRLHLNTLVIPWTKRGRSLRHALCSSVFHRNSHDSHLGQFLWNRINNRCRLSVCWMCFASCFDIGSSRASHSWQFWPMSESSRRTSPLTKQQGTGLAVGGGWLAAAKEGTASD